MAKFSKHNRIRPTAPIATHGHRPVTLTHEGAPAFAPDLESELFLMAATYMAGERSFYESAEQREQRFVDLVHMTFFGEHFNAQRSIANGLRAERARG